MSKPSSPLFPTSNSSHLALGLDEGEYQTPITSLQTLPSVSECNNSPLNQSERALPPATTPNQTPFPVSEKLVDSFSELNKNRNTSATSSKDSPPSPVKKRIHPIAKMLKAKNTEKQLKRLPLQLNFQASLEGEKDSTNSNTNAAAVNEQLVNQVLPDRDKNTKIIASPKLPSKPTNKVSNPSSIAPIGSKTTFPPSFPSPKVSESSLNYARETKTISSSSNRKFISQTNPSVNISSSAILDSSSTAGQKRERATVGGQGSSLNGVERGVTSEDHTTNEAANRNAGKLVTSPKKMVDGCGYTLHKLQVEKLENELKSKLPRVSAVSSFDDETTKNKLESPPGFSRKIPSHLLSQSFGQSTSEEVKNVDFKSSTNLKTPGPKSPKIKPQRPTAPPPPLPTKNLAKTEGKSKNSMSFNLIISK